MWNIEGMAKRRHEMTPGQRVASWRRLRGWTLRQLATASGMSAAALCRVESGKQRPKADEVERIAAALGITTPQFYGEMGHESDGAAK
jgi:transcriptional regulator with XRE-family HTH domain